MKKYIFLTVLATLSAFVSCDKETGKTDDSGKAELTIQASIASSKAAVSAEGISWTAGDALLVLCDSEKYNFSTAQGGATAEFTSRDGLTQEKVGINPLTAYHGCTEFGAFTIPQNQIISGGESQTKLPMYAYTATAPDKGKVSMTFSPAASVIEVKIAPADITLNKVELLPVEETSVVGNVAGAGTVNAVSGKVTFNGNLKSLSAIFQGGESVKNGLAFRFPVGWFSVSGGMKLVLTYNGTSSYEEILWDEGNFQSYEGSGDTKSYKFIPVNLELVLGARDYYVAPDGKASSKGLAAGAPTTLDYALSSAESGSVIHLAEGTYHPSRILLGDENDADSHKTFEIARGLTLVGAGQFKTILDGNGAFHTVCVTAKPEEKVTIKDLYIKGGDTSEGFDENFVTSSVNGGKYSEGYGAGLYVIGSDITLEGLAINDNKGKNGVGAYFNGAKVNLKGSEIMNNTSTGNGCGLWAAACEISIDDCLFQGNKGGGVAAGLYIYAAEEKSCTATVHDCVFNANETTNNNCAIYVRGADASAKVTANITDCIIKENKGTMGAGFGTIYATVLFDGCQILKNTASGNGCNYIQGGSMVTVKNCIFRENTAGLGAAIYHYTNSDNTVLNVINSEFSANTTGNRGGAIYSRAGAAKGVTLNVVNSTIFGNQSASTGSAIALNGTKDFPVNANIYSSTITGNTCTRTAVDSNGRWTGGAIGVETLGVTTNIYNSVVAGNIYAAKPELADIFSDAKSSSATSRRSIVNTAVYDGDGVVDGGAAAFDAASMLSKKTDASKTTVFSLTGSNNPAKTYGYDAAGLKALGATIDGSILEKDQWGNVRTGAVMGAYVE